MKVYYGLPEKYIDVTDKLVNFYDEKENKYIIPADDLLKAHHFTDPHPFKLKHIIVEENGKYKMYNPNEIVIIGAKLQYQNKKIVIYTCVYGNYDVTHCPIKQDIDCDYICLTDNKDLIAEGFKTVYCNPVDLYKSKYLITKENECMMNVLLCRSDLFLIEPLKKYDICIYIDANKWIHESDFISNILNSTLSNKFTIVSEHGSRKCLYQEAYISKIHANKFDNIDLDKQCNKYRREKYPENNGLYWNGFVIFLQPFAVEMKKFYEIYTEESMLSVKDLTKKFHFQGQVTFPYVLWKADFESKTQVINELQHYTLPSYKHTDLTNALNINIFEIKEDLILDPIKNKSYVIHKNKFRFIILNDDVANYTIYSNINFNVNKLVIFLTKNKEKKFSTDMKIQYDHINHLVHMDYSLQNVVYLFDFYPELLRLKLNCNTCFFISDDLIKDKYKILKNDEVENFILLH